MKILVAGWFSFERMGATAGDLMVLNLVSEWLDDSGYPHDTAVAPPFTRGVDLEKVDPAEYSDLVFVCGPFGNGPPITELLNKFENCRLHGLDLSMLQSLNKWNPFDELYERDSSRTSRADLVFLARQQLVPVVGVVLVHPQEEYGKRSQHECINGIVDNLLSKRHLVRVPIDTRLDINATSLRSAPEVESLIARMDAVVTTRLHGLVLSLRNGIPPLVIDPIAGGAKVTHQAKAIGWPMIFNTENVSDSGLAQGLDFCLSYEGRSKAVECNRRAVNSISGIRNDFLAGLKRK